MKALRAEEVPGLPGRLLKELGIGELYPVQAEAIRAGVLEGASVLVSAPTASGKTLVAMMAVAASLEKGMRAFYTAPLRSIASERYSDFRVFERLGYTVRLSIGDLEKGIPKADVTITTYEKLDSTLRQRPGLLEGAGVVVVDEIHYIGDPKRGPGLEVLIARMLAGGEGPQIVALSATVSNAAELADWLGARLVESSWRPVPLREGVYTGDGILFYPSRELRPLEPSTGTPVADLAADASRDGGQTLVFSQSRRRAVQLAKQLARHSRLLYFDQRRAREAAAEARGSQAPRVLREELAWLLERGVAYHHAGLSNELRSIVERAFREGGLAAVSATPTLAAGVNLPARRVVVAEYYRFEGGLRRPIGVGEYKQLAGRAGRPGLDPVGEAVIVPQGGDDPEEVAEAYILGSPEPMESRLAGLRGVRHAVVGLAASGASSAGEVEEVLGATLYARRHGGVSGLVEAALSELERLGVVERMEGGGVALTPLGAAVARYYVDPASVGVLRRFSGQLPGASDPQLLYIISIMPDMPRLPVGRREADRILDMLLDSAPDVYDLMEYAGPEEVAAAKTALILYYWVEERGEDEIAEAFDVGPGDLASLVDAGRWLASAAAAISENLEGMGSEAARRFRVIERRVRHGVRAELLPLVEIPGVGRVRARRLYDHGYRLPQDLALADPRELARIPGIGPATVASILEYLGRAREAETYWARDKIARRGLLAFMED